MTEPRYRKATIAEALEVLLSRHGDKFSPAERDELQEAIERLQRLDAQTVPVEPESVELLRASFPIDCDGYKPVSFQHIHATLKYIDTLQSALQRVTEERDAEVECRNAAARAYEAAESLNKRMVELLKEPSEGIIQAGADRWKSDGTFTDIFKAMSAELLKEVGE